MKDIICLQCYKKFIDYLSNHRKFCSIKCKGSWQSKNIKGKNHPNWKEKILVNCLFCSKKIYTIPSRIKTGRGTCCSKKCLGSWQSENLIRERAGGWKNGNTPVNKLIRASLKYKLWASGIKKRDNYTCQICNVRGGILRSNHIKKFSDYPKLHIVLTNGITVCEDCDLKFVMYHEELCEDFFNFNLIERGYLL